MCSRVMSCANQIQHDMPATLTYAGHSDVVTWAQDDKKVKNGNEAAAGRAPRWPFAAPVLAAISIMGFGHVALQARSRSQRGF